MKEPTMEEVLELVSFERDDSGRLCVRNVLGNVKGNVSGDVEGILFGSVGKVVDDVRGDVLGNVEGYVGGDVEGPIYGSVGRGVWGTIDGSKWQYVD